MTEPHVRGVMAAKDTPLGAIMSALFGTDPNDPEIVEVARMSNEEIDQEAAKLHHLVRRPTPGREGPHNPTLVRSASCGVGVTTPLFTP
jgi:hypothetical protein